MYLYAISEKVIIKKTYFKKIKYNDDTYKYVFNSRSYIIRDRFVFTHPKIRKIIDTIRSLGFNIGKNNGNNQLFGVIYYDELTKDKINKLREISLVGQS